MEKLMEMVGMLLRPRGRQIRTMTTPGTSIFMRLTI